MKKIGLLVPKTNLTVEYELQYLISKNYSNIRNGVYYIFKLDYKTNYKTDKIKYLKEIAEDSIKKINDMKYIGIDEAYFFCTSSSVINEQMVISKNPMNSLISNIKNNNINKCLLITPYNEELGKKIKSELIKSNIIVTRVLNLNLINTEEYFDFGINKLKDFILQNYKFDDCNIVLSCTNLPTISVIEELEKKLGIKIISSNSSMFEQIVKNIKGKYND